jgi:hypothetical protein
VNLPDGMTGSERAVALVAGNDALFENSEGRAYGCVLQLGDAARYSGGIHRDRLPPLVDGLCPGQSGMGETASRTGPACASWRRRVLSGCCRPGSRGWRQVASVRDHRTTASPVWARTVLPLPQRGKRLAGTRHQAVMRGHRRTGRTGTPAIKAIQQYREMPGPAASTRRPAWLEPGCLPRSARSVKVPRSRAVGPCLAGPVPRRQDVRSSWHAGGAAAGEFHIRQPPAGRTPGYRRLPHSP